MISISTYYLIKENQRKIDVNIKQDGHKKYKDNSFEGKFDVFPVINKEDIYDFIKIKDSKPIINDDMIAKVFNLVIKGLQIAGGDIDFEILKISDNEVILKFTWNGPNTKHYQNYKIKLTS